MSDYIDMKFKDLNQADVLSYCIKVSKAVQKDAEKIIRDNIYYIPSIQTDSIIDSEGYWRKMDRYWLYKLFRFKCVYWRDKELLGLCGNIPKSICNETVNIVFQNSTDQDYEFSDWTGIGYFESCVDKVKSTKTREGLLELLNQYSAILYTDEDFDKKTSTDYIARLTAYKIIYNSLDLQNWLYSRKGNFEDFTISAIDNYSEIRLYAKLVEIRNEYINKRSIKNEE